MPITAKQSSFLCIIKKLVYNQENYVISLEEDELEKEKTISLEF